MDERPDELDSWQECLIGLVFWLEVGIAIAAVAAILLWAAGLIQL
jgi:hypothetical protein